MCIPCNSKISSDRSDTTGHCKRGARATAWLTINTCFIDRNYLKKCSYFSEIHFNTLSHHPTVRAAMSQVCAPPFFFIADRRELIITSKILDGSNGITVV
jgi:hypothetical protein